MQPLFYTLSIGDLLNAATTKLVQQEFLNEELLAS